MHLVLRRYITFDLLVHYQLVFKTFMLHTNLENCAKTQAFCFTFQKKKIFFMHRVKFQCLILGSKIRFSAIHPPWSEKKEIITKNPKILGYFCSFFTYIEQLFRIDSFSLAVFFRIIPNWKCTRTRKKLT